MRYFLKVSYKGTNYHGWQVQKNAVTVQGLINVALEKLLKHPVETLGSGRTDSGVHARCQILHFDTDMELNSYKLIRSLNALLPYDIVPITLYKASHPEAHARFDAITRSYRYEACIYPNPFWLETVTLLKNKPDLELLNQACEILLQIDDFETVSKVSAEQLNHLCKIYAAQWHINEEGKWIFDITANRFLRGMVRLIVGNLLEVGIGKITIADFKHRLLQKDRKLSASAAESTGLYLQEVVYPEGLLIEL